jgi:hypothetical protein
MLKRLADAVDAPGITTYDAWGAGLIRQATRIVKR